MRLRSPAVVAVFAVAQSWLAMYFFADGHPRAGTNFAAMSLLFNLAALYMAHVDGARVRAELRYLRYKERLRLQISGALWEALREVGGEEAVEVGERRKDEAIARFDEVEPMPVLDDDNDEGTEDE